MKSGYCGFRALYRARPAEPTAYFGPLLRDVFTPPPSPPSTRRGLSWQDCAALLVPVIALAGGSIAGKGGFVKGDPQKKNRSPAAAHGEGERSSGAYSVLFSLIPAWHELCVFLRGGKHG